MLRYVMRNERQIQDTTSVLNCLLRATSSWCSWPLFVIVSSNAMTCGVEAPASMTGLVFLVNITLHTTIQSHQPCPEAETPLNQMRFVRLTSAHNPSMDGQDHLRASSPTWSNPSACATSDSTKTHLECSTPWTWSSSSDTLSTNSP